MSQFIVSNRYAQALFELSEKEGAVYPVYISMQEIGTLLKEKNDFKVFIQNPLLTLEERVQVIKSVFQNRIPKILYTFLLFLNVKDRLNILADIVECFDEIYLEKNNKMRASLETAFELHKEQVSSIEKKLNEKYKKEISLDCQVKPELLGGFRLLAEGTLYDGTIKTQLEQFRQKVLV